MPDLHAVFAYTIYGDKIRVSHYGPWNDIIISWSLVDKMVSQELLPTVSHVCVCSWVDPEWNLSRYRSLDTVSNTEGI